MKIAIVANNLRAGGGYTVACNFIPVLLEHLQSHRVLVILPHRMPDLERAFPWVSFRFSMQGSTLKRFLWQKTVMTRALRAFKPDWTFFMGNYAIKRLSGRSVMLLHNSNLFSPVVWTERSFADWLLTHIKQWQLRTSLAAVTRIYLQGVVPQMDFVKFWKYPAEKTSLLKLALPDDVRAASLECPARGDDGIFRTAYVSRAWPAKNHDLILRTYELYKDALAGTEVVLTVDPAESPLAASMAQRIRVAGLESQIKMVGVLSRQAVFDLYRTTDALVMPTEKETLGYPYLEAMYFGCPIITSDKDFAKAICADAAIYVDSHSPCALKDAILRLKGSEELRASLASKGRARLETQTCDFRTMARSFLEAETLIPPR